MSTIKSISFYIVLGTILTILGNYLESDFLFKYLKENIIGLLITLLAINTATSGLIASKIQDIVIDFPKFDFSSTIREMKISLFEQIILICLSVITLLLLGSKKIEFIYKLDLGHIVLTTVLIYAISILWDTGKAVFIVIEELQKMNKD